MTADDRSPDVAPEHLIRFKASPSLDKKTLDQVEAEIQSVYAANGRPWVIGYSGGKDSTTALQLVWYALAKLPEEQRRKPVYVIASDTLVETPVIVDHLQATLNRINVASSKTGMPFQAHKVRPKLEQTFWVNMIGRGYPAPYRRFRWCTDRLKIDPANRFIEERVNEHGEVVLILGVRRDESATRALVMSLHRKPGELLSRHSVLLSAWVYTPIQHFSTDDVWTYLLTYPSPWGSNNRDLVTMYRNAQAGECPLVVDKTTPSCGNSRFGCWVCTVVERDRSMESMIDSGEEWMTPLLDLRDWLTGTRDPARKHQFREVRRRSGQVQVWGEDGNKIVWGPYRLEVRREILRMLLRAEQQIRLRGPDPNGRLIADDELHEIRRLWRSSEGDWLDSVPTICTDAGRHVEWLHEDGAASSVLDATVLARVCADHGLPAGVLRELMDLERTLQGLGRRTAIQDRIEKILGKDWRTPEQVFAEIGWQAEVEDEFAVGAPDAP